jgi:pyocin large subunit-like protein
VSRPARPVDEWVEILTDWVAEAGAGGRTATEVYVRIRVSVPAHEAWDWLVAEGWVRPTIRETPARTGFGVRWAVATVWVLG